MVPSPERATCALLPQRLAKGLGSCASLARAWALLPALLLFALPVVAATPAAASAAASAPLPAAGAAPAPTAAPAPAVPAPPLPVVVSILPQKYLVQRLGGGRITVTVLVREGFNPETYEPSPRQIAEFAHARLYFTIGIPFERIWLSRIQATSPAVEIVDLTKGLLPADPGAHANPDPHLWTSPVNAAHMASAMRDALVTADPAHAAEYQANHAALAQELTALDHEIRARLKPLRRKHLLVFHPSWDAFASAYGLKQIAIEQEGREPGPKTLEELIRLARRHHIRTVFVQQQMSTRAATTLAEELGGSTVVADPLAEDYPANLRKVVAAFAHALGAP